MKTPKPLLVTLLFFCLISMTAFSQCKTINVEAKVTHTTNGMDNGSIELEIQGASANDLTINLFGPKKNNRLGLSEILIHDLRKGKYTIVVSAKRESTNLCPKSINVTIN